jgi:hypothetical protein
MYKIHFDGKYIIERLFMELKIKKVKPIEKGRKREKKREKTVLLRIMICYIY